MSSGLIRINSSCHIFYPVLTLFWVGGLTLSLFLRLIERESPENIFAIVLPISVYVIDPN